GSLSILRRSTQRYGGTLLPLPITSKRGARQASNSGRLLRRSASDASDDTPQWRAACYTEKPARTNGTALECAHSASGTSPGTPVCAPPQDPAVLVHRRSTYGSTPRFSGPGLGHRLRG